MFVLEADGQPEWITIENFRRYVLEAVGVQIAPEEMASLYRLGLVELWNESDDASRPHAAANEIFDLTHKGMAVLINASSKYLDRVISGYNVPESTTAALIPLLDVSRVPAADRYVSTADNHELFTELATELEKVKDELVHDQNANELPIPIQSKRAMAAELGGLIGQIRAGYLRISDLTQRARPLLKGIADTCKDVGIIAGFAYAAYQIIGKILESLF